MTDVVIRRAIRADLPGIIAMIADDQLGATRESVDDLTPYEAAFEAIDADPNQLLVVADRNGEPIGTLQLTIIPGLSRRGSSRGLVEAVRVAASARGIGLGSTLMEWAIEESRNRGCALVQLTSDKSRTDAHRFYDRLGFENSHEGFKLKLS
ncbi:ribosomal protein S18 acetylase RimI-like enzyme [Kribbella sp. VKM Ac-2527]|jgi:ribosomal protein S18 acetylase RimI-like enzyme|uniref:Ribosomal protein S18 acetylase RimI-like enzyme n=1 Tax=Kribbella caucasensis TaxID=2512215 RepID=A0A4R6JJH5_9ACTN|nr:GNAT family N-acetyltransferase [Kribbella sp. VKM Ac-2527]TDO36333.1 ribosomal protein S18 acetylase RimI-like enzyme [Kribbella sp. VKM Ac-2527]